VTSVSEEWVLDSTCCVFQALLLSQNTQQQQTVTLTPQLLAALRSDRTPPVNAATPAKVSI